MKNTKARHDASRRRFLGGAGAAVAAAAARPVLRAQKTAAVAATAGPVGALPGIPRTTIRVTVNRSSHRVEVEDRWTLAELLRDHLKLTGTKLGCERGECGACTVLIDGKPAYSCSSLAVWADGRSILTVEGLARGGRLDPLQQSFADHDAPQCGFCTSGQLMSARALLNANPHPTADEVRAALSGNLCRCANYNRYVEAVLAVAQPANLARARATQPQRGGGR